MQNRTKGAEIRSSKPAMLRKESTLKRNFQKLRESPGVRYESVGRGFESLPSHQEKPVHICVLVFLFVCTMEGARTRWRRTATQAISPVGCCLACGSQQLGMSIVEAVKSKDFMAFFVFPAESAHFAKKPCYSTFCENDKCPLRHGEGYVKRHAAFAPKPAQRRSFVTSHKKLTAGFT